MTKWWLPLTLAAVLVGALVFLASRELGAADEYAGVGSFVIAFIGLGLSLWTMRRAPAPDRTGTRNDALPGGPGADLAPTAVAGGLMIGTMHNEGSNVILQPQQEVHVEGPVYRPVERRRD
ncbi:hypothetical protein MRQ36_12240 [Micromonospora sp. R77]|uniref:hypothetical protein n=1 Tax=Micromonospora sp. R77 TaxID=2925836 RepID=UPI001F5FFFFB|nr:hypothetical protein [Micromonospora sp. R77]MCI4063300.1 hypothetical protein [Micromonospora sp. R77]